MSVGAMTRLTGSGLSIVEWKPLSGVVPPLNALSWDQEFQRYKQFPEFQSNPSLSLEGFKYIFWWEFSHRLLARSIVVLILLPYFILLLWRKDSARDLKQVLLLLILIGIQGALGWYMVQSGLVKVPRVSHLRLMVHFIWASFIIGFLARWLRAETQDDRWPARPQDLFYLKFLSGVCLAQMALGALVAGSRAGYIFNTFPKMGDTWTPSQFSIFPTVTENLIYNQINLQFFHRLGGWLMLVAGIYAFWRKFYLIGSLILIQFLLGVFTLILMIPVSLATFHQLCAVILFFVLQFNLPSPQER